MHSSVHGRSQDFFRGRNTSKIFKKNLLRKLRKCTISAYFSKNWTNHALIFRAFGRKTQSVGNFEKIFENLQKISLKNCKMHYFSIFFKSLTKHALIFRVFGRKTLIVVKFWENFRKFAKDFLRKLPKMHSFSIFFQKNLTNHALIFCAFGRKTLIVVKFW